MSTPLSARVDGGTLADQDRLVARRPANSLTVPALLYVIVVAAAAVGAAAPFVARLTPHTPGWGAFFVLAACAAVAQLFVVRTPRNQSYHTSVVFVIAAVLVLPAAFVALLPLVQHIPEWVKNRNRWYGQVFNICNYTLDTLAALAAAHAVRHADGLVASAGARTALAAVAACAVFVALNHTLLAILLRLGPGHSFRETRLFSFESLSTDLVLATLGVGIGTFWDWNPWLIPFAAAPLLVLHRSLTVPALEAQARVDPKTGLFNARHFARSLTDELQRASRLGRPLSLLMVDLDLLREINNTYGHLAGDAVLKGVARVFRTQLRDYDVPARFGGEEFSILLPETSAEHAREIAERIRRAVADQAFEAETSSEPIRATVSIGVAAFPQDGSDENELVHQADVAVYRAKLQGRNRVLVATADGLDLPARKTPLAVTTAQAEMRDAVEQDGVSTTNAERRRQEDRRRSVPRERTSRLGSIGRCLARRGPKERHGRYGDETRLHEAAATIQARNVSLERTNGLLRERSLAAMESLAATVDARDAYTAGHGRRVQRLTLAIGAELDLSEAELDVLGKAALFHDIGKVAIPDAVVMKPGGLSPDESALMRTHADEGARIIGELGVVEDAVPAIRHHHERFDGRGYPDGLRGDEIPLGARIIHVADALDSIVTTRIYQRARPVEDALEELRGGSGTQFCPRCVAALERALPTLAGDDRTLASQLLATS
ncbi:MAG: diguanylate cyclase [Actinomycetota bacterium]|nr:diguanylate cyclase [Actinomycetota bacterium]